ncbi:MAG: nucleotide-binding domain containing protein, partial [Planctomycetota bacterium]
PMRDADLLRVLTRQVAGEFGRIDFSSVNSGAAAIRDALTELSRAGIAYAIPDVLEDTHLMHLGRALAGARLITGGSGIALGLAENFRAAGELGAPVPPALPDVDGGAAVIAGSCSEATREQVAVFAREHAAHQVEPTSDATASSLAEAALSFTRDVPSDAPLLIYSSAAPAAVAAVQSARGRDDAGALVEAALAKVAQGLVGQGRRRLVVAGGETSGAVTTALGIERLTIGPEIDPGVPWTLAEGRARNGDAGHTRIALALKSGNFGAPDFFSKALAMLP